MLTYMYINTNEQQTHTFIIHVIKFSNSIMYPHSRWMGSFIAMKFACSKLHEQGTTAANRDDFLVMKIML